MRRVVLTVLATLTALVAIPLPPAAAVVTVIDQLAEISDPYSVVRTDCSSAPSDGPKVRLVSGPSSPGFGEIPPESPPLGTGSLQLHTPALGGVAGVGRSIPGLSGLSAFSFGMRDPDGLTSAVIRVNVGNPLPAVWTGYATLDTAPRWGSVTDLMTRQWAWYPPDGPGEEVPTLTTIEGFLSTNGDGPATVRVHRQLCGPDDPNTSRTHVDALTITLDGETETTLNFEAAPIDLTIAASPTSIPPGGSSTVTGSITVDGEPYGDVPVKLMHSTNGIDFTQLTTDTPDASGNLSAVVSPTITTQYRWDFNGALDRPPASSGRVTVTIQRQPALTISASRGVINLGDPVDLTTAVTIDGGAAPGVSVVLRKQVDDGGPWTDVTTVVTNGTGVATATDHPTDDATYRWHVVGNAALLPAQSPSKNIRVRLRTLITSSAVPTTIDHGASSTIRGVITIGGAPAGSTQVELWGGTGFPNSLLATVTSNASGQLSYDVALTQNRRYEWRYAGSDTTSTATSPSVLVTVRFPSTLTMALNPRTVASGEQTTFSTVMRSNGLVASGTPVNLDVSIDGGSTWTRVVGRTTDVNGAASYRTTPVRGALYRWRFDRTAARSPAVSPTDSASFVTGMTISTTSGSVQAGGSATVSTKLGSGGGGLAGQDVTLQRSTNGGQTWTTAGVAVTNGTGNAQLVVSPAGDTRYRWRFDGTTFYRQSTSPTTSVVIAEPPQATALAIDVAIADGNDDQIYVRQHATIVGTLTAAGAPKLGRHLDLEFSTDGGTTWRQLTTRVTDSTGRASVKVSPTKKTRYRWRFAGGGSLLPSTSVARILTVNPQAVTAISNSTAASVVDAGERARLSTVLTQSGSPFGDTLVTLQRRIGSGGWESVATVRTGADGQATASVEQDVHTSYRWVYPGSVSTQHSISPTVSVQARFVVTASVLIAPAHAGENIIVVGRANRYAGAPARLMRPNLLSPVEMGRATLRNDGTFRILAPINSAGTYNFYVEVGPDPFSVAGRTPSFKVVVPN